MCAGQFSHRIPLEPLTFDVIELTLPYSCSTLQIAVKSKARSPSMSFQYRYLGEIECFSTASYAFNALRLTDGCKTRVAYSEARKVSILMSSRSCRYSTSYIFQFDLRN